MQNPKKANPGRNVGLDNKADYGESQKLFDGTPGGYAWIAVKASSVISCNLYKNFIVWNVCIKSLHLNTQNQV